MELIVFILSYFIIGLCISLTYYAYIAKKYVKENIKYSFSTYIDEQSYDEQLVIIGLFWPFVIAVFIIYTPVSYMAYIIRKTAGIKESK